MPIKRMSEQELPTRANPPEGGGAKPRGLNPAIAGMASRAAWRPLPQIRGAGPWRGPRPHVAVGGRAPLITVDSQGTKEFQ